MKLLLVDDHQMVRLGLKSYFELQDDVEVVGEATNNSFILFPFVNQSSKGIRISTAKPCFGAVSSCTVPAISSTRSLILRSP